MGLPAAVARHERAPLWPRAGGGRVEIGEKLGWSTSKVKQHSALLGNVVTKTLEIARNHQEGRVTDEVTTVTFTERWFRDSGLYDLDREGTSSWAESGEGEPKRYRVAYPILPRARHRIGAVLGPRTAPRNLLPGRGWAHHFSLCRASETAEI